MLLERFLVRLSLSKHNSTFIFKGGLLLSHYLFIARETADVDFSVRSIQAKVAEINKLLIQICNTQIKDGFKINVDDVEQLEHNHMNYPGFRSKLNVNFGNMHDRIQIDIGIGDKVKPKKLVWPLFQYKEKPIFEDSILLFAYPVETIFSEKLETIISKGGANSRMKDYHDILLLCRNNNLIDLNQLKSVIKDTFSFITK